MTLKFTAYSTIIIQHKFGSYLVYECHKRLQSKEVKRSSDAQSQSSRTEAAVTQQGGLRSVQSAGLS